MAKKRVFISFDYDHDETLKTFLIGQAKLPDSPFELADWSIKEHMTGNWKEKARARIRSVDVVIVLCGLNTNTAAGVSAELAIARDEAIPYFLLSGYKDRTNIKPTAALTTDKMYKWTWDNLKILIDGGR
ncbi:TIR domain-containing protein (plasmid) [Bosea vestrisii]|uniref:TIR domain-containing protein n=1 Tax=Bosea vestrisii TaxID=151416 RepID=UPI0024E03CD9|nr:TIR domain-containing protein [Bosea vestrisii]WID99680.1 TIR domain-containing protein [Bosea vestrisii]